MKKCNKVIRAEHIKIEEKNIKVEYKNLHGNCQYVGLWEHEKNLITIDADLTPEDAELVKNHEDFHAALCLYQQGLGCDRENKTLCEFSTRVDDDPFLMMVLPEYGIGYKREPVGLRERFWDILWHQGLKIMRYIASMRVSGAYE